ncbi:hypothetical protein WOSG25_100640 [Weissella oryzae SG25]|uniref:Uncharacterized protein n=1 Tax=Weissella oryzae (strain DSM 25784 / JCM 18191 / LMG 30913 / SG25) TaxID=1329250 RepID=A0A069CW91_WEIOS|nr:hypothetical protein [Weissella oryzae]GAK31498.1 hypothetical protein WOSG25_100640 [Weissella oryzae SG25]
MNLNNVSLANLFLGLLFLLWMVRRQLTAQILTFKSRTFIIIMIIGVYEFLQVKHLTFNQGFYWFFALSLVNVIVFGFLRALSTHFWINDDGLIMRQGNWITLVLWILTVTAHLGIDRLWTSSGTTALIYLGATLFVQRGVTWHLASNKYPELIENNRQFNHKSEPAK